MIHLIENTPRAARSGRLGRAMTIAVLAAAPAACDRSQPVAPERAAPDRPSLALNPACDPGLGGTTHTDSVLAPETWARANNPHRVNTFIHIAGAGVLTLEPGVLVCFGNGGGLRGSSGGRLVADGLDTSRIVLSATDAADGWLGVSLAGTPASASTLKHVRIEHTRFTFALSTYDDHAALIDSAVIRKNERGVYLWGRGSRLSRSRVDTVTSAAWTAVTLGNLITFEQNVIRGAAGSGLFVAGTNNISLLGGRIEGSGGVGLKVTTTGAGFVDTEPVRVVGGASYPAELVVSAFPRIYPALADQDSLLGNARDTVVVTGGILQAWASPGPALPWRVTGEIVVQNYGILIPKPGATLAFTGGGSVTATNGGRVLARGTAAAPVLFTKAATSGWGGLDFEGASTLSSYLTNVRIEGAGGIAVAASHPHPLVIDSAVFRQNGSAVYLWTADSRISRSRVDTTLISQNPAVSLGYNSIIESTLIRGSAGEGLLLTSSNAQVVSCEIRESAAEGVVTWAGAAVHNCNLVGNGGVGIRAANFNSVNAEDNWWGDAAGPTGPNGDGVSTLVDYTPWRTTPYALPYVP